MSSKITLTINGSRFNIDAHGDFASFLKKQLERDFNTEGNNDFKMLLQAYVRKNYELYTQEIEIQKLLKMTDGKSED